MTWSQPTKETWLTTGYRIYQGTRDFSVWTWTPKPLSHLGFRASLADAQKLAEQHAQGQ